MNSFLGLVHIISSNAIAYNLAIFYAIFQRKPMTQPAPSLDKSPQRIRRMFDQVAPRYDLINHLLSLGLDFSWRRRAVDRIFSDFGPEIPKGPLLDVCCGTGDLTIALNQKLNGKNKVSGEKEPPEFSGDENDYSRLCRDRDVVVGVDFSSTMIEHGREKIRRRGAERQIAFFEGDALRLPFEDSLFSVVSVGFGLRNVADLDRGIAEMVRVARPGGKVAILDFTLPKFPVFSSVYRFYLQRMLPFFGQFLSTNREEAYRYFSESVMQFEKGEALAERLRAAGLAEVRFFPMTLGTVTLYLGTKREKNVPE